MRVPSLHVDAYSVVCCSLTFCRPPSDRKTMRESLGKNRLLLSPAPASVSRATLCCDSHGVRAIGATVYSGGLLTCVVFLRQVIICANAAVESVFGFLQDELVDTSMRLMLQFLPKKRGPAATLKAQPSEGRFSRTDMWMVSSGRHERRKRKAIEGDWGV